MRENYFNEIEGTKCKVSHGIKQNLRCSGFVFVIYFLANLKLSAMLKPIHRYYFTFTFILIFCLQYVFAEDISFFKRCSLKKNYDTPKITKSDILFDSLNLGKLGLGRRAYDYAMLGYNVLKAKGKLSNENILSIADLTLPSGKKRFFVIDVKSYKLLFVTYVAHGKKSGLDKALYFSNEPESNKSSVGFYTTLETYTGSHGYSLRLAGHEIGFNSNALVRAIVVHSAKYVDESIVKSQGYLGRSLGCPALSPAIYKNVIDKIKNGTCLFVYGNDSRYILNSKLLKQPVKTDSTGKDSTHK